MGERWSLSSIGCGVASPLGFPNNNDVRYFHQAWLREATDIGEGKRGDMK